MRDRTFRLTCRLDELNDATSDPRPQGGLQEPDDPEGPASGAPPSPRAEAGSCKTRSGAPAAPRRFVSPVFPRSGFVILRLIADRALAEDCWLETRLCERLELESAKKTRGPSGPSDELRDLECLAALVTTQPPRRLVQRLPPRQLLELERHSARTALPPLRSLATYWRLDARAIPGAQAERWVALLESFAEVEVAYREISALDPQASLLRASQGYLRSAPVGIGSRPAALQIAAADRRVQVIDLEQGWLAEHEDLPPNRLVYGDNRDGEGSYRGDHGTAVLGELVGTGRRIEGAARGTPALRASHYHASGASGQPPATAGHVADAAVAAILETSVDPAVKDDLIGGTLDRLQPEQLQPSGDVLLIEVQRGLAPAEIDEADFDAFRLAAALGMVVVEAAGNGNLDLDRLRSVAGERSLARAADDSADSGAIVVGASLSALPHDRAPFSNFGSRVDCYGWGENVATTGYGELDDAGGDPSRSYTHRFSGTSSAAPVISGAAVLLQDRGIAGGRRFTSRELRRRLSAPSTGTPQGPGRDGEIGVMPDLERLLAALGLEPRAYLRATADDRGAATLQPRRSESPDVLVLPQPPAEPARALREDALPPDVARFAPSATGGTSAQPPAGFVFARLRNPGRGTARQVATTVYAAEPAPLVPPDAWRLLGTAPAADVPQGDIPQVVGPIRWPAAVLPAVYLAVTTGADLADTAVIDPAHSRRFEDYLDLLARHSRRQVIELAPSSGPIELPFSLAGAADQPREFGFALEQRLPEGATLEVAGPVDLIQLLAAGQPKAEQVQVDDQRASLRLPAVPDLGWAPITLPTGEDGRSALRIPVSLRLEAAATPLDRGHRLAWIQLYDGIEVGRLTWRFV